MRKLTAALASLFRAKKAAQAPAAPASRPFVALAPAPAVDEDDDHRRYR